MNLSLQYCDNAWLLLITVAALAIACFFLGVVSEKIYGDDNENDFGLCLNYHVKKACARVEANNKQHDLQGNLWIWNTANCSVRDICTPDACFATKELADKYMDLLDSKNETGNVHYPCPKLNVTHSNNDLEGK